MFGKLTIFERINYIFHDIYAKELDKMDPFEDLTLDDMRTAIRNATVGAMLDI